MKCTQYHRHHETKYELMLHDCRGTFNIKKNVNYYCLIYYIFLLWI